MTRHVVDSCGLCKADVAWSGATPTVASSALSQVVIGARIVGEVCDACREHLLARFASPYCGACEAKHGAPELCESCMRRRRRDAGERV